MSRKLSAEMRRVLEQLRRGPMSPRDVECSVATYVALERRKLIRVETTFSSIAFPRGALAWITEDGRVASFKLQANGQT